MDLKGKHKNELARLLKSFSYAANGLMHAIYKEHNLRIHLVLSVIVISLGFYFNISRMEWSVIIILIGGMLSLELMNTAVERVVDLVTKEYHPLAKMAKDISAAAVLLFAIASIIIGIIIFSGYLDIL
ncbi:diacylglycerol kinase family protein [Cytobacillus sp. S13-E01]|uniref:diacylglycerol kinase family protein n=1 Tax=Cytobacillus sp. S13-E01 TaxID=3031326 RepID=UPI0023D8B76C|nr:diacylglycerol kinase family protein [Cytobacillus sp. S13-E01]MDF0727213.1 diacylglycerol kinase family protein [Cytobacillus sp. S13-E01]